MSNGLVYLRPVQVAYLRIESIRRKAVHSAWAELKAILTELHVLENVERAYGFVHNSPRMGCSGDGAYYFAGVQVFPGLPMTPESVLRRTTLPGGAYLRHRHKGGLDEIGSGFTTLCGGPKGHADIVLDQRRPLIEVYSMIGPGVIDEALTELCAPVLPRTSADARRQR